MPYYSYLRNLLIFLILGGFSIHGYTQDEKNNHEFTIKGRVIDKTTKKEVSFATLYIEGSLRGIASNINGLFEFPPLTEGKYQINISCINYASNSIHIDLKNDTTVIISLNQQTLKLAEVEVMATYKTRKGSNAQIKQTALEYIQPISLSDIFLLLPGNIMKDNVMQQFELNSSRQVGADQNTSLGMAIISDGIPLTNDAMRTQLHGISGEYDNLSFLGNEDKSYYLTDQQVSKRTRMNAGVDMRNISTDHIESIEVIRGISSAKDGNLSSGAIKITSKKGVTPLKLRTKSDPLNKLLYMGKGFKLSDKIGSIHLGADILSSTPDVREKLDRYTRITAQANYTNKIFIWNKTFDFSTKLNLTSSINNTKSDELIVQNNESYKNQYLDGRLSFKGKWLLDYTYLESLEILSSISITSDLLKRNKMVINNAPSSMPSTLGEGEHEGIFLPSYYYSYYEIDNRPVYFFLQTNFISRFTIASILKNNFQYGLEFKSNKNIGKGASVNAKRPPYPGDNTFIRPRPNYDIPALMHTAGYIEDNLKVDFSEHIRMENRLGVRTTKLLNLNKAYTLSKKILIEPRLQINFTIENVTNKNISISNSLRLGYGEENKLPTIDLLYPDKLYRDFIVLNAFYQDPERDYLLVNTYIHNPTNFKLEENKSKKIEVGWDFKRKGLEFSLTVFKEEFNGGFSYLPKYYNISFTRYMKIINDNIIGKPNKDDYEAENYKDFTLFPTATNSAKTTKKGVEYRIKIPTIRAIKTSVEINGSYYKTVYTSGIPVMYRPIVKEFGEKYPYIGIYSGDTHKHNSRLNTNFWFNTHIEKFGLVFTNFVQVVWFTKSHKGKEEDVYPSHYIDLDGVTHKVDKKELITTTGQLRYLKRERSELYYREEVKPISIFWNIKASKQLSKKMKLSFFVNNLADFNPYYKKANNTTRKDWFTPFFGAELVIHI